jgi:hypothetical protein
MALPELMASVVENGVCGVLVEGFGKWFELFVSANAGLNCSECGAEMGVQCFWPETSRVTVLALDRES